MSDVHPTEDEILKVIGSRLDCAEFARAWFEDEPLPGFSAATAEALVETGRGQEVLDYVAAVDAGNRHDTDNNNK